jgi:V/A-type H+-transporting ATPase subunit C
LSIDSKYAYAVGRIRVIEDKLFDKNKIDRMVDAKTADEAFKLLIDSGYGYSNGDDITPYDYEVLLKEEYKKVYDLLLEMAPAAEVFDIFLRKNDYHNLKVLLKAEFLGIGNYDLLLEVSAIPIVDLEQMVKNREWTDMSDVMKNALEECINTFNKTQDPQMIDLILDRALYIQIKEDADKLDNSFVSELISIMIDLTNINILMRIKKIGKDWGFFKKAFLPGGSIKEEVFFKNLNLSDEKLIDTLRNTEYEELSEEGITDYIKTGSFTKLEKLSDNYIISFIKKAKHISLGVQPLVAYLLAKENEIKILRIIMVSKINNIPSDVIRERLRDTYV